MMKNPDKLIPAHRLVFLNNLNLTNCIVAALANDPGVRKALVLTEDCTVQMLPTWDVREGDLDLPPDTPMTPEAIEAHGYRLMFEPEGGRKTSLSAAMNKAGEHNLLKYVMQVSGYQQDPEMEWLRWYLEGVYANQIRGQELVIHDHERSLRSVLDHLEHATSLRGRDVTPEGAKQRTQALEFAIKLTSISIVQAQKLYELLQQGNSKKIPDVRNTQVFVPSRYPLDPEDKKRLTECLKRRRELFIRAEQAFVKKKLKSEHLPFDLYHHGNERYAIKLPKLGTGGKWVHGRLSLVHFTAAADKPESYLYQSVSRLVFNRHLTVTKSSFKEAPAIMVRFHSAGKFFAQTDTGSGIDPTVLVIACRQVDIKHRKDLSTEEKAALMINTQLLGQRGTPDYGNGRMSHVVFGMNGLTWGNTYGDGQPAITGKHVNEELISSMTEALRNCTAKM